MQPEPRLPSSDNNGQLSNCLGHFGRSQTLDLRIMSWWFCYWAQPSFSNGEKKLRAISFRILTSLAEPNPGNPYYRESSVQLTSMYQLVYMKCFWYRKHLLFCKSSYPNEEVNRTEPSLYVSLPCLIPLKQQQAKAQKAVPPTPCQQKLFC